MFRGETMDKAVLKKVVVPVVLLTCLLVLILWILSSTRMDEKIPSKGVFVYSKEFYENV